MISSPPPLPQHCDFILPVISSPSHKLPPPLNNNDSLIMCIYICESQKQWPEETTTCENLEIQKDLLREPPQDFISAKHFSNNRQWRYNPESDLSTTCQQPVNNLSTSCYNEETVPSALALLAAIECYLPHPGILPLHWHESSCFIHELPTCDERQDSDGEGGESFGQQWWFVSF